MKLKKLDLMICFLSHYLSAKRVTHRMHTQQIESLCYMALTLTIVSANLPAALCAAGRMPGSGQPEKETAGAYSSTGGGAALLGGEGKVHHLVSESFDECNG